MADFDPTSFEVPPQQVTPDSEWHPPLLTPEQRMENAIQEARTALAGRDIQIVGSVEQGEDIKPSATPLSKEKQLEQAEQNSDFSRGI